MLINAQEKLRNAGTTLGLASLNPMVLDVVKRSPLNQILGKDRIFYSIEEAVKKYEERL
jgi:SulP family sulfate permease